MKSSTKPFVKLFLVALSAGLALNVLSAQTPAWQPSAGHTQVPIWPGTPPDAQPTAPEVTSISPPRYFVAGKPTTGVENISRPTMTVFSPAGKNTGAAVIVFPGGGYEMLVMDLEGTDVCDWLVPRGITCIVLKYRVPGTKLYPKSSPYSKSGPYPRSPIALEDAQRTLRLVRFHAAQWHIDPHKIGVLGFSAGGHLVVAMSTAFDQHLYPPVDAADKESARPDFAIALYPGHLTVDAAAWDASQGIGWANPRAQQPPPKSNNPLALNPDIHITRQTPPTFLLQNEDDHVDNVNDSLAYYIALKNAGIPVEMHLYAQGGHGFGLRRTQLPVTGWPQLVDTWLNTIGIVPQ
jgi:acetyl esterase/lipase